VPAHRRAIDAQLFYQVDERKLLRICEAAPAPADIALRNGGCSVCELLSSTSCLAALLASFLVVTRDEDTPPQASGFDVKQTS
jgi:hypothetical protein